jgi:hypothetical protein
MLTTLVVAVVVLVVLLLVIPVDVDLRLERGHFFRYRLGVRWLYGLVGKEIEPGTSEEVPEARKEPAKKKRRRREKAGGPQHILAMLRSKGFLRGVARLTRRLLRAARFRDVAVWLRAGFEDPASTGLACGLLLPVVAYLRELYPSAIDVAPDFSRETFQFAFAGQMRITPVNLLWPVVAFGLSPSTIRGLVALRRGRGA